MRRVLVGILGFLLVFLLLGLSLSFGAGYDAARIYNGGSTPLNTMHIFHYGGGAACSGSQDDIAVSPSQINPGSFATLQVPTALSGTGETGSASGFDTNGVGYCSGNLVWTWPVNGSGQTVNFYLFPVSTNNLYNATVTNGSGFNAVAYWKLNGTLVHQQPLAPGQVASYLYTWTGNGSLDYGYNIIYPTPAITDNGAVMLSNATLTAGTTLTNMNGNPGATNFLNPSLPGNLGSIQLPGNIMATNGGILWNSPDTGAARDSTLKAGLATLHSDNQTLLSELASQTSGSGGGSNVNVVGSVYDTNESVVSITNLALGTNAAAALTWGSNNVASSAGDIDSLMSDIGGPPSVPAGDGTFLDIAFAGGTTLHLDPEVSFLSGIGPMIKNLIAWLAGVWFLLWAGNFYVETVKAFTTAQTGGVPNLETTALGFGGNLLGVVVAIAIPALIVGLWVIVFTMVFGQIVGEVSGPTVPGGGGSFGTLNPFTGYHSGALYLMNMFLPTAWILSLCWTRITLYFVGAKLIWISGAATRFLWGK